MTKIIVSAILLLGAFTSGYSQIAYYDADSLQKFLVNGEFPYTGNPADNATRAKMEGYCKILRKYIKGGESITNPDAVIKEYMDMVNGDIVNPFMVDFTPDLPNIAGGSDLRVARSFTASFQNVVEAASSFDAGNFADGVAQFLVERAKEELYIAFFEKFQKFLSTDCPELQVLFPNTVNLLNNFKSWEYANVLSTLREAFDKDLKQLLADLPKLNSLKEDPATPWSDAARTRVNDLQKFFTTWQGWLLQSTLQAGGGFLSGAKLPLIIHSIADPDYLSRVSDMSPDVSGSIELLDIFSSSITSKNANETYISLADLNTLFGDDVKRNLFLGLIYQQVKNDNITLGGVALTTLLTPAHVDRLRAYILNLRNNSASIVKAISDLNDAKATGTNKLLANWGKVFEAADQFIQQAGQINVIDPSLVFSTQIQSIFSTASHLTETADDIALRNYNAAIVSILNILTNDLKVSDKIQAEIQGMVKYFSFAANVVAAKNSTDAKNAIESIALPAGSASVKKNSRFNIALNGYIGGFWGNEYIPSLAKNKWSPISGVTAPIGITFSKPIVINNCSWGSASLFLSILDVGAFASYRLSDTSTSKLPSVTLANIFAPGVGLIWGIPKWPLSIGYTYQFGPALRDINADTKTVTTNALNQRWSVFLSVDIPILNFYTKPK